MAYTKGMNPDAVRERASQIDSAARDLRSADAAIQRTIDNLGRQWDGFDYLRFRGWWETEHRPSLHRLVDSIEGLARSARHNADDQDRDSTRDGPTSVGPSLAAGGRGRAFDNRNSFTTNRSMGFIFRGGGEDGFSAQSGSHGSTTRYRTGNIIGVDTGDVFEAIGFAAAIGKAGKLGDLPFSAGLRGGAFTGTEFIWEQQAGSHEDSLRGTNEIPIRQAGFLNQINGYSASDVMTDIGKGEYAIPAAVANFTGVYSGWAGEFESGHSVFGGSGELKIERVVERWADGSTVDRYTVAGSAGVEVGVHADTKALGLEGSIKAISGSESVASVSYVRDQYGIPETLVYTVTAAAEVGTKGDVGVGGGGASGQSTMGGYIERELSFDLTNPSVRAAVENGSTSDWVRNSHRASESVKVFATGGDAMDANAILFEAGFESNSMTLLHSATRGPNT